MKRSLLLLSFFYSLSIAKTTPPIFDKGWWWYEEKVKDPVTKKEKIIKYKLSPSEKMKIDSTKKTEKLLKLLIIDIRETKKVQEEILKKLKYAYPNVTPKYTKNKKTGEKCLTNSSSDCFIMPVIAEGQHVPVLKNFLRNPSPKNSKEWLKWQATYFNHLDKVSTGLRFAYLKGGSDTYGTTSDFSYGDNMFFNQSQKARATREAKIIASLKKNLGLVIFLGQDIIFEKTIDAYSSLHTYENTFMKDLDIAIAFPSYQIKKAIDNTIIEKKKKGYTDLWNVYTKLRKNVKPDLFKKYSIRLTPSVIVFYKDPKTKKTIWQNIATGDISADKVRTGLTMFLTYNGIISKKDLGADKAWATGSNPIIKSLIQIPKPNQISDFNKTPEEKK